MSHLIIFTHRVCGRVQNERHTMQCKYSGAYMYMYHACSLLYVYVFRVLCLKIFERHWILLSSCNTITCKSYVKRLITTWICTCFFMNLWKAEHFKMYIFLKVIKLQVCSTGLIKSIWIFFSGRELHIAVKVTITAPNKIILLSHAMLLKLLGRKVFLVQK